MPKVEIYRASDKFFADERGWVLFPFQSARVEAPSGMDLSSLHLARTEPGQVRANHYHRNAAEWLLVFGGRARLFWEEQGEVKEFEIESDDVVVFIPAGTPHAIKNSGPAPIYLAAFRDAPEEAADTIPHQVC